jgi:hypothetical protein
MNEESILRQSLLFTGKLVGIVAVWVALLSLILVAITGRAIDSLSGGSGDSAEKSNTVEFDGRAKHRNDVAPNPGKPNG